MFFEFTQIFFLQLDVYACMHPSRIVVTQGILVSGIINLSHEKFACTVISLSQFISLFWEFLQLFN